MDKNLQLNLIFLSLISANSDLLLYTGNNEYSRATLQGFPGVQVILGDIAPEIEKDGLIKNQLEEDTERAFRAAGIKMLSENECGKAWGSPLFYISPHIMKIRQSFYIYNIRAEFSQLIYSPLVSMNIYATTWLISMLGYTPFLSDTRDSMGGMVDNFIRAFLSVNPKD